MDLKQADPQDAFLEPLALGPTPIPRKVLTRSAALFQVQGRGAKGSGT